MIFVEVFCCLIILWALAIFTGWVYVWNKNKKESNRVQEYGININSELTESVPDLLESIVSECFNEYIVLNIEYQSIDYINDELELKIMKEVGALVSRRISPAMLSKLSLYYNLKYISEIISDKIYIATLNYVLEKNSVKENKNDFN